MATHCRVCGRLTADSTDDHACKGIPAEHAGTWRPIVGPTQRCDQDVCSAEAVVCAAGLVDGDPDRCRCLQHAPWTDPRAPRVMRVRALKSYAPGFLIPTVL